MSDTRVNKLSRKRTLRLAHNRSSDDFTDDLPLPRSKVRKENQPPPPEPSLSPPPPDDKSLDNDPAVLVDQSAPLPDCPLCGKSFSGTTARAMTTRNSHLKACGLKRGLDTEKLLKIRQLEEKQAEERVALGLPAVVRSRSKDDVNVSERNTTVRSSNKSTSKNATRAALVSNVTLILLQSRKYLTLYLYKFFLAINGRRSA